MSWGTERVAGFLSSEVSPHFGMFSLFRWIINIQLVRFTRTEWVRAQQKEFGVRNKFSSCGLLERFQFSAHFLPSFSLCNFNKSFKIVIKPWDTHVVSSLTYTYWVKFIKCRNVNWQFREKSRVEDNGEVTKIFLPHTLILIDFVLG